MAVTADTVYPISHHWYSRLLASVGRLDDSLVHARRAHEMDPDSAIIISRLAIANYWVNNVDMAERYFGVVNKMTLEAPIHDLAYALFLVRKGRFIEAGIVTKRGLEKYGFPTEWVDPVYEGIEDPMKRDAAIDIVSQLAADGRSPRFIPMALWALLGETDSAMQVALKIENPGQGFESEVVFIHEFRNVRAHEDFPLLLNKLDLDDYSDEVGCEWIDGDAVCSEPDQVVLD